MRAVWVLIVFALACLAAAGCRNGHKAPEDHEAGDASSAEPTSGGDHVKAAPTIPSAGFDKGNYATLLHEDRVWVFAKGSDDHKSFLAGNEPAKNVTMVKAGPGGYTLRSTDVETLQGYIATRDGFVTEVVDGRIWVFRPGSEDLATFRKTGEPAKYVIRPASGPGGMTVKAPDNETLVEYLTWKPGFVTRYVDGRLWVFVPDSEDLATFEEMGEPAKHVIRPAAGPDRMTLKAPTAELIEAYMAAAEGFETIVVEGRIWVFRPGSEDLATYRMKGEPAKFVIRPAAGPLRMTVKAPDNGTMSDYLRMTVN